MCTSAYASELSGQAAGQLGVLRGLQLGDRSESVTGLGVRAWL